MRQIYERKVTALNRGGLARRRRTEGLTPVEPVRRRTAESQEVSRGHSTEKKPFGKDRTIVVLETKEEEVMQPCS